MATKPAGARRTRAQAAKQRLKETAPVGRYERTRLQTRMKLVAAAKSVMARTGVEGATIAEIAGEADVGFGSFYNHFTSKEEIAEAVFASQTEDLAKVLDMARQGTKDPALAVSFIQRLIIRKAYLDPVWGWFIVRAQGALPQMQTTFKERAAATLGRGTRDGLIAVIRNMLEEKLSDSVGAEFADLMLRLYGVAPKEAASLSRLPLPPQLLAALDQPEAASIA
jgi:AcrR family transcriptional regulator